MEVVITKYCTACMKQFPETFLLVLLLHSFVSPETRVQSMCSMNRRHEKSRMIISINHVSFSMLR